MLYDPLIGILNVAENYVEHPAKSAALRNLQIVLRADPDLSRELGKRIAAVLRDSPENWSWPPNEQATAHSESLGTQSTDDGLAG